MTATRLVIGLVVTVLCFAVAGRRFWWIKRLISTGAAAPGRWNGFGRRAEAELVEVAGQRKLLQWTVPGLAHFFTMWGFTILMTTILEAYGALFEPTFHIPLVGTDNWLAFVEDFFAVAVLVALAVFAAIRLVNSPARRQRQSRFYGSHTGAAWLVLAYISAVMITLLVYRGAQVVTGHFPYGDSRWAFASHTVGTWLRPLGTGTCSVIETTFLLLNIAVIMTFLVFVAYSKHLHIFMAPINVAASRRPRALGGLDKTPDMDMENVTEDTVFGVGHVGEFTWKQMLDFATCTECVQLVVSAARWRPPRRRLARGHRHRPRRAVELHHVRGVRRGVPRRHRAHRRHCRHAALRGTHGVAVPHRGRTDAAQPRESGRPVGHGRLQAD